VLQAHHIEAEGKSRFVVWGLRDYGTATMRVWGGKPDCEHEWATPKNLKSDTCSLCGAAKCQLGLEPHPSLYIEHLVEIFHEVRRVLKSTGSLWIVIGDTYYGSGGAGGDYSKGGLREGQEKYRQNHKAKSKWLQPKQKLMMPARVAIALQEDGWILRNEIVWHKPNNMPESVRDRLTRTWESIFFFVKQRQYYFDLDAIRVKHSRDWRFSGGSLSPTKKRPHGTGWASLAGRNDDNCPSPPQMNPLGKNPGDTFSGYNTKYEETNLNALGRSQTQKWERLQSRIDAEKLFPNNIDKQREYIQNIHDHSGNPLGKNPGDYWSITTQAFKGAHFAVFSESLVEHILKCACPPEGIVLDPFMGSGTTCYVARKLLRHYIGIDLNPEYVEMTQKRLDKIPQRIDHVS